MSSAGPRIADVALLALGTLLVAALALAPRRSLRDGRRLAPGPVAIPVVAAGHLAGAA